MASDAPLIPVNATDLLIAKELLTPMHVAHASLTFDHRLRNLSFVLYTQR